MQVLILPGDGIGPEIAAAARRALEALDARFALGLQLSEGRVGLAALERDGTTWPDAAEAAIRAADLAILGPVDTAAYPPPEEGGVNPSAAVRTRLELYANMRPSRALKGVPALAPGMDLLVARENTEGFYADRNMFAGSGEFMATEDVGLAVRKITRRGSERIARAAFSAARDRRRKVTVVHKSNVLKHTDGLFERVAYEVAADWPEVEVDDVHVDAAAALLVREPERFDVLLCTNMFGDILSNLGGRTVRRPRARRLDQCRRCGGRGAGRAWQRAGHCGQGHGQPQRAPVLDGAIAGLEGRARAEQHPHGSLAGAARHCRDAACLARNAHARPRRPARHTRIRRQGGRRHFRGIAWKACGSGPESSPPAVQARLVRPLPVSGQGLAAAEPPKSVTVECHVANVMFPIVAQGAYSMTRFGITPSVRAGAPGNPPGFGASPSSA